MNKPKRTRSLKKSVVKKKTTSTSAASRLKKKTISASKKKGSQSVSTYKNLNNKNSRRSKKDAKSRKKAEYLATLPKSRVKRFFARLHPKRVFSYWFSRQGMIMAAKIFGLGFFVTLLVGGGVFVYFRRDLPDPRDVSSRLLNQTTKFYDRSGENLLFELYGDQNRTLVEFDSISDHMKHATVAVEDKDFYEHGGFSVRGTIRAFVNNVTGGSGTQGGSTITQQFIKNSLLTNEQTIPRKIKELILALELERLYSKDEILSFYLNEIPYGSLEYGIEAAAQSFFSKSAADLSISESALLAALPQAPSYFSPYGDNTDDLLSRQKTIITLMEQQGYISSEDAERARNSNILAKVTPAEQRSLYNNIEAPHFVLSVQEQLEEEYGATFVRNSGLKIITTLDYDLQKIAEKAVEENIATVVNPPGGGGGDNTALVSTDVETGQVVAMVGSRDFRYPEYGSFNAALAERQPGSSIKPFGYAELFSEGTGDNDNRWGPDSYIYDTQTSFGDYSPKNYDSKFKNRMTVREAIGQSRNIPAVKALYLAGIENTINLAKRMGDVSLGTAEQYGLSFILGAGEVRLAEHTHAYATFARDGVHKEQSYILSVENTDGEILQEWEDSEGEQVLDPQVAYLVSDMLSDDDARVGVFGRNNPSLVVPGLTHTVKTGTTDSDKDGWMMGYTRYLSAGVWVGNHDNTPMGSFTSRQTGPIFTQFLKEAHEAKGYENVPIHSERPAGIQTITLDQDTGYAATDETENTYTGIFPSWYVAETSDETNTYTIDTVSQKAATECTPERAIEEVTGNGAWPEIVRSDPWYSIWASSADYGESGGGPTEDDDVHSCDDALPNVNLVVSKVGDGIYKLSATISKGTHPLDTINFKVDDQIVNVASAKSDGTYEYTHAFTTTGSKKLSAEVIDSVLYDNTNTKSISVDTAYAGSSLSLTAPAAGATVSANAVTYQWSSVSEASSYRVCWEPTTGGSETCISTSGGNTSYKPGSGLDDDTSYGAFVEAYLGNTLLQTSSPVIFSTN